MINVVTATLSEGGLSADVMDTPGAMSYICAMGSMVLFILALVFWVTWVVWKRDQRRGICSRCANNRRNAQFAKSGHSH
jgi:hypothetical protein